MCFIYVSEPDLIDIQAAKVILDPVAYTLIAGDTAFHDSEAQAFEVLLIRSGTTVDSSITNYFPNLKHVIRVGAGLDKVDLSFCKRAGIAIYNAPGANADAVAEYAILMLLYVLRKLYLLDTASVREWQRSRFAGRSISGCSVGIVGFGHIGRLLQVKLRSLGCTKFFVYDPYLPVDSSLEADTKSLPLDTLLKESDIVSLNLPLNNETHHLITAEKLALLKNNVVLLNAARGAIVDEQALLNALEVQHLTYIADTVEGEPHVNPQLLTHENVIITPHIASLTDASERAMLEVAVTNFLHRTAA